MRLQCAPWKKKTPERCIVQTFSAGSSITGKYHPHGLVAGLGRRGECTHLKSRPTVSAARSLPSCQLRMGGGAWKRLRVMRETLVTSFSMWTATSLPSPDRGPSGAIAWHRNFTTGHTTQSIRKEVQNHVRERKRHRQNPCRSIRGPS